MKYTFLIKCCLRFWFMTCELEALLGTEYMTLERFIICLIYFQKWFKIHILDGKQPHAIYKSILSSRTSPFVHSSLKYQNSPRYIPYRKHARILKAAVLKTIHFQIDGNVRLIYVLCDAHIMHRNLKTEDRKGRVIQKKVEVQ